MNPKELAVKLAKTEKEAEVISLLKNEGYWNDNRFWVPFGNNPNNFGTIGNQQSAADAALVEKLTNSIDAVLEKECLLRGIDPESNDAPQSMAEAMNKFFKIPEGKLSTIGTPQRTELSKNIILATTGLQRGEECIVIADKGEGQTPQKMPDTILSIGKSNKLKIPFVQGRYNMGGTGALPFCGDNCLQLVISRRCQSLKNTDNDSTFNKWGFTIVRREDVRQGNSNTMFTYLTKEDGTLFTFEADSLSIIPLAFDPAHPDKYDSKHLYGYEGMQWGMYLKLYNYDIRPFKTNSVFDLNYRLSMLMPSPALPVRIREARQGFKGHSLEATMSGLITRLESDREESIEEDFPLSSTFHAGARKEEFKCMTYLFKLDKDGKTNNAVQRFRRNNGVFFIVNGQTHAVLPDSFFNSVGLNYLAKSLLVLVDCTSINPRSFEDMFMASRDRLRKKEISEEAIKALKENLREMSILKQKQNERRANALQNTLEDDKPMQELLQKVINNDPVMSKIFLLGTKLKSPLNLNKKGGSVKNYIGKLHPTFFRIEGKLDNGVLKKRKPCNHSFRVQFKTDVTNDYFARSVAPGSLELLLNGKIRNDLQQSLNLLRGTATLTVSMPENIKVGDILHFSTRIEDSQIVNNFLNLFDITVTEPEEYSAGGIGQRKKPTDPDKPGKENERTGIAMPNVVELHKSEWEHSGLFTMNESSALIVVPSDQGNGQTAYDYYINMDNASYLTEQKAEKKEQTAMIYAQYKYSMAMIGMAIVNYYNSKKESTDTAEDANEMGLQEASGRITSLLAPVIIPMIRTLGSLPQEITDAMGASSADEIAESADITS